MNRIALSAILLATVSSVPLNGVFVDDRTGIDALHEQDIAATLSRDKAALAALWVDDAVRLGGGGTADIGKAAIIEADERARARHPNARIVSYSPDIKDVTISGRWAFEWGYFTVRYIQEAGGPEVVVHAKLLRVLHKQGDGNWRFARVMWNSAD